MEISRGAYEVALDVFEYSGLIRRRYAYGEVVALPPVWMRSTQVGMSETNPNVFIGCPINSNGL